MNDGRPECLFGAALGSGEPVLAPLPLPLPLDRSRRPATAGQPLPAPLRGLPRSARPTAQVAGDGPGATTGSWRERLAALPARDRAPPLVGFVREEVAAVLGHSCADAVAPDRSFPELGFDSLTGVGAAA